MLLCTFFMFFIFASNILESLLVLIISNRFKYKYYFCLVVINFYFI
jgi:hypothetical protein